jgi:lysozyme
MGAVELLLSLIKTFEGCKLTAYWDSTGKCWTVGWGCTGPGVTDGTVWTQQYADASLRQRVQRAIFESCAASPTLLHATTHQQAAIADFVYNLGLSGYTQHSLKPLVDASNWVAASEEIKKFCHSGGVELPGLVKRRLLESSDLLL